MDSDISDHCNLVNSDQTVTIREQFDIDGEFSNLESLQQEKMIFGYTPRIFLAHTLLSVLIIHLNKHYMKQRSLQPTLVKQGIHPLFL